MNFNRRKDTILKLESIEEQFPVTEWMVNGIHIWPILKNLIFFNETINKDGVVEGNLPLSSVARFVRSIKKGVQTLHEFINLRLDKADFVFSGGYVHRVWHEDVYINRYFDPMISYLESKKISALGLEYLVQKETPIEFLKIEHLNAVFYINRIQLDGLRKDQRFRQFLELASESFSIGQEEILRLLKKTLLSIISWKRFYRYIFKKVKPKYSFGLCYYNNAMYGMILAAKELGITSIDMQHGTQGRFHAAYQFSKVPENGYSCLPDEFWCWEGESFAAINNNPIGKYHKPLISGNPWITYLSGKDAQNPNIFPNDKPLILFTHQPLHPVIDEYLLETIQKTKKQYYWWIRLHPRISTLDREELYSKLAAYGLIHDVELDAANSLPLPTVLKYASLHISKFSGSIIEARLIETFSLILEEIGVNIFEDIIKDGKAIGLPHPTTERLINMIQKNIPSSKRSEIPSIHFKEGLEGMLSNN